MTYWMLGAVAGIALLLMPVKVRCGSPGAACAMPPAPRSTAAANRQSRHLAQYRPGVYRCWGQSLSR